jgi:hypothetical protein
MKKLLIPLYKIVGSRERKNKEIMSKKTAFVVLGFQRSGTSLICDMLNRAGVSFGAPNDLMAPDSRNPNGFFEHKKIFSLSRKFLRQSNVFLDFNYSKDSQLKAFGVCNRVSRFFTRISLMKNLSKVSKKGESFGIKSFPVFWYFLKPYIGERVVFAIYRDPFSVMASFDSAWFGRFYASQILNFWTIAHQDMIFHLSGEKKAILISYEDLLDTEKRKNIVQKISEISGLDSSKLESVFDDKLNRSGGRASRLKETYPLPEETEKVLASLEKMKI